MGIAERSERGEGKMAGARALSFSEVSDLLHVINLNFLLLAVVTQALMDLHR